MRGPDRGADPVIERGRERGLNVATLSLDDARLSSRHARVMRFGGIWAIEDLGSKNGMFVRGVRTARKQLFDGDVVVIGHTALVFREAGGELHDHVGVPDAPVPALASFSPSARARFDELATAAPALVSVELTGESGTGKELAARAVHALSGRQGRFVAVNCGALPSNLIEAELFGHAKGAYTGADQERVGLVRAADGGTLFLDEIAELPLSAQAALLRVLQEREVLPVGSDRSIPVNLRLITATLKSLDEEVAARRFRDDLRARILGVQVELPPLRERREDLGWLIAMLLKKLHGDRAITFTMDAVSALYSYDWLMNIRELEHTLSAACLVSQVHLKHLPRSVREPATAPPAPVPSELSPEDVQLRDSLVAAIDTHDGNLAAVARQLGRDRKQIHRWIKRFGLKRES